MTFGDNAVTFFAETNFRHERKPFGIKRADRRTHMYVIGKTGTGKSTMLETLILQDLERGEGLTLLDPHGDLVDRIRAQIPAHRRDDLVDFNVAEPGGRLAFNPLERVPKEKRPLVASGMLEVFKKIWADSWGPRLEHILRNTLLTLLDQPEPTLADALRLLRDPEFRGRAVARSENAQVRDFWLREFAKFPANFRAEAIAPIQNKVGAFLADPVLNGILTQPRSAFDLRQVMDHGKILLVNLSKGRIGEDAATLLGALLVSQLGFVAQSRADTAPSGRPDFYIYLDEFQTFTTQALATMLAELRKYGVGMVLAHQYLSQLDLAVRDAVLGNVGTLVAFRLGQPDAEVLAPEFSPVFSANNLASLPNRHIYVRLMIDGAVSRPFSGETMSPKGLRGHPTSLT
jgi:type IV secretory pathway TraG/TraD family ATPase VirD4